MSHYTKMLKIFFFPLLFFSFVLVQAVDFTSTVAAYNMESLNAGNLIDITGNNHSSNGLGGTTVVSGYYGNALQFDGNDQIVINDASDLRVGNQMTIEAHFMVSGTNTEWVRVIGKGQSGPRNYGLWYRTGYNNFGFQAYSAAGNIDVWITQTIEFNRWYHIAGTYNGSVARLYLDGIEVGNQIVSMTPYTSVDPLTIGGADFHSKHIGLIDNAAVFNTALSSTDIALHASGNIGFVPEPASIILFLMFFSVIAFKNCFVVPQ